MKIFKDLAPSRETRNAMGSTLLTLVVATATAYFGYLTVKAGLDGRTGKALEDGSLALLGTAGTVLTGAVTVKFWQERRYAKDNHRYT
jgi:hypothetical protein